MVFDEVDAGRKKRKVSTKLRSIARATSALHDTSSQIASKGDFHLKTEKGQKRKDVVEIRELSGTKDCRK
jgi:DNA repair ATPase RecN